MYKSKEKDRQSKPRTENLENGVQVCNRFMSVCYLQSRQRQVIDLETLHQWRSRESIQYQQQNKYRK
jgi:hypothetical protein